MKFGTIWALQTRNFVNLTFTNPCIELEEAINKENTVRYIKYKRLSWLGHVERMTNERVAKTIYKWKPYATRPKGRPKVRWEDDVRNGLRKMGVNNWKQRTQERKQWKRKN